MKKLILVVSLMICICKTSQAQFPQNYPFKTYIDENGFLYITGDTTIEGGYKNVIVKKYHGTNREWKFVLTTPATYDRGMDIIVDNTIDHNVYITGYVFNSRYNVNNITTLKLSGTNGALIWSKTTEAKSDSKGFGIALDDGNNVYVGGFINHPEDNTHKNFLTIKYDLDGNQEWKKVYDNNIYHSDDVATDILVDDGFVYLMGTTYQGQGYLNDIMLATYEKSGNFLSNTVYIKKNSNEIPTGFIFTNPGRRTVPVAKSRTTVTGVSDFPSQVINSSDYLTINFNDDSLSTVKNAWIFNNEYNGEDVATAIVAGKNGIIYVTGYTDNGNNNYDFATIKYNTNLEKQEWVKYFNYPSAAPGNDRASSLLIHNDSLFITGPCERAPNGFWTESYSLLTNGYPINSEWSNTFIPSFLNGRNPNEYQAAAVLGKDSSGNILNFVMGWNNNFQSYAAQMYDVNGNIIYTMDSDLQNSISFSGYENLNADNRNSSYNETDEININKISSYKLSQNYPNPFNPTTKINYELPASQ